MNKKIEFEQNAKGMQSSKDLPKINFNISDVKNTTNKSIIKSGHPTKAKMKGYIFLRKNKDKNETIKTGPNNEESGSDKSSQKSPELSKYKITEENNKLIEQMINRKRQNS